MENTSNVPKSNPFPPPPLHSPTPTPISNGTTPLKEPVGMPPKPFMATNTIPFNTAPTPIKVPTMGGMESLLASQMAMRENSFQMKASPMMTPMTKVAQMGQPPPPPSSVGPSAGTISVGGRMYNITPENGKNSPKPTPMFLSESSSSPKPHSIHMDSIKQEPLTSTSSPVPMQITPTSTPPPLEPQTKSEPSKPPLPAATTTTGTPTPAVPPVAAPPQFPVIKNFSQDEIVKMAMKRKLEEAEKEKTEPDSIIKRRVAAAAQADRHRVSHPDYKTPFSSHEDAWQRLLSYHVYQTENPNVEEWKEQFKKTSENLVKRSEKLQETFFQLVRQSTGNAGTEDIVMLEKLNYMDEKANFEQAKTKYAQAVQQARSVAMANATPPAARLAPPPSAAGTPTPAAPPVAVSPAIPPSPVPSKIPGTLNPSFLTGFQNRPVAPVPSPTTSTPPAAKPLPSPSPALPPPSSSSSQLPLPQLPLPTTPLRTASAPLLPSQPLPTSTLPPPPPGTIAPSALSPPYPVKTSQDPPKT